MQASLQATAAAASGSFDLAFLLASPCMVVCVALWKGRRQASEHANTHSSFLTHTIYPHTPLAKHLAHA